MALRYVLGPLVIPFHHGQFIKLVKEIQPDLVHALRVPFEGMLAASVPAQFPLVVSIWGNDLTLHAKGSLFMAHLTRRVLQRADGLIADASRDIRLAFDWGFPAGRPSLVVPGAGGIDMEEIAKNSQFVPLPEQLSDVPIVINPRGQRPGSLRQDVFFKAIPLVLNRFPKVQFICPSLAEDKESHHWVETLGIQEHTRLWPKLDRSQMWGLLRKSQVYFSPSIHDGTPNSLLEAMAAGCLPVVGNIESMREWVTPDVNGVLVDANSAVSIAEGILSALENPALRSSAKKENARIIAERAAYQQCMAMAEAFYKKICNC